MKKVIEIEGIGEVYAKKLNSIGINTMDELLEKGATPSGRKSISEQTEVSMKLILRWINMADLFRIKGIGEEYSDLLEAAGVDTVPELGYRNPDNLYAALEKTNQKKQLVRQLPAQKSVADWVDQAQKLPKKIVY